MCEHCGTKYIYQTYTLNKATPTFTKHIPVTVNLWVATSTDSYTHDQHKFLMYELNLSSTAQTYTWGTVLSLWVCALPAASAVMTGFNADVCAHVCVGVYVHD